ncbi:M23 family metallopeptidase [Erythrobacter donghaensis]|uniref:M23 family metallopeptidase n=1 Tax=Erythrobacter donghaensis TaxID=267135 RepID=UPI000A38AA5D|nr:M23 family metallopeptidase [Erythrobacter donghaensis]
MPGDDWDLSDSDFQFFPDGKYPVQLKHGFDPAYHGEYRGFYPEDTTKSVAQQWRPESSRFDGRTPPHGALDIYAPFAPHPLETPVCAVADGDLVCRVGDVSPNGVWNRAEIHFGKHQKYSYGHLSRFEGRNRKGVKRGEVIGYAGCTGNADTQQECSKCGECRVNSGHVHLIEFKDTHIQPPTKVNPLISTGLKLRYGAGDDSKTIDCKDLVKPVGSGRPDVWMPPGPSGNQPRLISETVTVPLRAGDKGGKAVRTPLAKPFQHLEFADTKLLESSRDFYALCDLRRSRAADAKSPLGKFLETRRAAALDLLTIGGTSMLGELKGRVLKADRTVIGLEAADPDTQVAEWVMRHLSYLNQMLWVAFGGPALNAYATNVAGTSGGDRYKMSGALGTTELALADKALLECGGGLGGSAWLSASSPYARTAIHRSWIDLEASDGKVEEKWVYAVSFGAGSLMHATVSHSMADYRFGGTKTGQEMEERIDDHISALRQTAASVVDVNHRIMLHSVALSGTGGEEAQHLALAELRPLIQSAVDRLLDCALADLAFAQALLDRLIVGNRVLFAEFCKLANKGEKDTPFSPTLYTVTLDVPA